jgi:predicted nucleic acid-binding protein
MQVRTVSARDAIHGAVMQRHGISTIMTFDRGFASLPGISILAG